MNQRKLTGEESEPQYDLRKLTGEEFEQQYEVWSQAFEHGDRQMTEWREWDQGNNERQAVYGLFDAGGLQATFLVVDMHVHFGADQILPMGAVNGVAVLPAARGKGYARAGVRYILERMRESGQSVSLLEPFSWDFYTNLGYAWIGETRRYAVPSRLLKSDAEAEHVRVAAGDERGAIREVYARYAGNYRGMLQRTDREWNQILDSTAKQHCYTYVYARDGNLEGYLTYRGGKREETRLREFLCLTARAQRGLLGLLHRHDMQIDKFVWDTPSNDTLWHRFYHWDVETKTRPTIMGRMVDVVQALQAWKPVRDLTGSFVLAIEDRHAPWNTGHWRVTMKESRTVVAPTTNRPELSLDIQALTQAFFGTPSLAELRRADRFTVHHEPAYDLLNALLSGPPMWVNDSF